MIRVMAVAYHPRWICQAPNRCGDGTGFVTLREDIREDIYGTGVSWIGSGGPILSRSARRPIGGVPRDVADQPGCGSHNEVR
jgi:hypothetical protein